MIDVMLGGDEWFASARKAIKPGKRSGTQLNFHLKKLANFWMWLGEEAKMGPILSVLQILCT